MAKFFVTKRVNLDDFGDGWKGCYISMIEPSLKEVQSINQAKKKNPDNIKVVMDIIENCFVTGKAYNGKEAIKITKDDIQDLPISVITKVTDFLLQISRKPTN